VSDLIAMQLGLIKPHFLPYSDNVYLNLMNAHQKTNQLWKEKQVSMKQQEKKDIILNKKDMEEIERKLAREILEKLTK